MPLPTPNQSWPPKELSPILETLSTWDAWYVGSAERLEAAYKKGKQAKTRPSQHAGGVVGAVSRWWWGRPSVDSKSTPAKLHIPAAADLAVASADLLFSEPPSITSGNTSTQDRITGYVEDGLLTAFAESAEISAALGGVYLRTTWDRDLVDHAFVTRIDADAAWPTFRWGRLAAVTFWHVVHQDNNTVLRHVESHETDSLGIGVVFHGLYQGTPDNLGRSIPLSEHPSTAGLQVDADSKISTLTPGLDVVYIPNQTPNRAWRTDPIGTNLGRSDYDGVEGLMDALDETWSSWMRDLRLGKARIVAADSLLQDLGHGRGSALDLDREVWSPVNVLASRETSGLPIEQVQFAIRVEEHKATADALLEQIRRTAGYSAQTFAEGQVTHQQTATEVTARERRSYLTRDRKVRAWQPAARNLVRKLLETDKTVFGHRDLAADDVTFQFADGVQESPETLARTATLLKQAEAASVKTLVQMVHPEWDETAVEAEAKLILQERGNTVENPFDLTE